MQRDRSHAPETKVTLHVDPANLTLVPIGDRPVRVVDRIKIGFIGLGIMGSAMAANLLEPGHDVTAYDRPRLSGCAAGTETRSSSTRSAECPVLASRREA
jgi:NAD binding domain of 6-phosphogluconate dehydrogenase